MSPLKRCDYNAEDTYTSGSRYIFSALLNNPKSIKIHNIKVVTKRENFSASYFKWNISKSMCNAKILSMYILHKVNMISPEYSIGIALIYQN